MQQALRRRRDWIRRNPEAAAQYIRLSPSDRAKVDTLFEQARTKEVTATVEKLDEKRRIRNRVITRRSQALKNIRQQLGSRPQFNDATVVKNVDTMTPKQVGIAAKADVDDLIYLAQLQADRNPFWYH